jgi:hypothetical protein
LDDEFPANFGRLLLLSVQGGPFSDFVWFPCRVEVHPSEFCNTPEANHPLEDGRPTEQFKSFHQAYRNHYLHDTLATL